MKKLLFVSLILLSGAYTFGQGVIMESEKMASKLLGKDVKYSIYLPYDYQTSTKAYPVLYLLHGYTDDQTGWTQWGQIDYIANKAIKEGRLPACIIVMPNGEDTWYCNDQVNNYSWEDMFITEFIPFIESTYPCRSGRGTRAIAGLSMGGWGALKLSMKHSDLFGTCIALSAAVFTDKELMEMPEDRIGERFAAMFSLKEKGEKRITEKWKSESVFYLLKSIPKEQLKSVRYYIDCGDDDFLYRGNSELHIALRDEGITHEYRVRNGAHSWGYWRSGIDLAFEFLSVAYEH